MPYGVATRISFDPKEAFPKFVFSAIRPLNDEEAKYVIDIRDGKQVANILNEASDLAPRQEVTQIAASPFEQQDAPATTAAAQPTPKASATASSTVKAAAPKAAPKVEPKSEPATVQAAPASFDEMLDNIL